MPNSFSFKMELLDKQEKIGFQKTDWTVDIFNAHKNKILRPKIESIKLNRAEIEWLCICKFVIYSNVIGLFAYQKRVIQMFPAMKPLSS